MTGPAAPLPVTHAQAEAAASAAANDARNDKQQQPCSPKSEAKEHMEAGAAFVVFGLAVLLGWLCLPQEAKHPGNLCLTISLLLSFATFLSGKALVLLSLNMMATREDLITGGQRVAAECLAAASAVLSVSTMLSLMALLPGRVYRYVGLALVALVLLPAAAVHWYLRRRRRAEEGSGAMAADEEHGDEVELEAAAKITSGVTTTAFGGLIGVLFSASKISGAVAGAAAYDAIFLLFAAAILGLFVLTVSKKVREIANPRLRRLLVAAVRLANAILLCLLASAAFAAAFVVLRYRIFAAFAALLVTATVFSLRRFCVVVRRGRAGAGRADLLRRESQQEEAQLKAMEDLASKVTTATLGAIMSVFGGALGEKTAGDDRGGAAAAMDVFMVVLTSAFVSGFGFMLLAATPGPSRESIAPAGRVLIWSSIALFAATAMASFVAEVWRASQN